MRSTYQLAETLGTIIQEEVDSYLDNSDFTSEIDRAVNDYLDGLDVDDALERAVEDKLDNYDVQDAIRNELGNDIISEVVEILVNEPKFIEMLISHPAFGEALEKYVFNEPNG